MPVRMAAVIPNEGGATKHWCFEIILLKKFAQSNEPPIYNDAFHLHQVVYSEKIQSILVCLFISSGCNIISAWDIDSYSVVNWLFQMLCAVCFNIFISILQSLSTTVSIIVESWKLKKNDFLQNPVKNLFSLTETAFQRDFQNLVELSRKTDFCCNTMNSSPQGTQKPCDHARELLNKTKIHVEGKRLKNFGGGKIQILFLGALNHLHK